MKKSENKNAFEESLQNAFTDFKIDAPKSVWIKIEKELDKKDGKKPLPLFNFRTLSIAASFILLFGLGGIFYTQIVKWEYYNNTQLDNTNALNNSLLQKENQILNELNQLEKKEENLSTSINTGKTPDHSMLKAVSNLPANKKQTEIQSKGIALNQIPNNRNSEIKINANNATESSDKPNTKTSDLIPLDVSANPEKNNSNLATKINNLSSTNKSTKIEIKNVVDVINFVAEKISSSDKKVLEIQKRNTANDEIAMNYQVDLGFFKISRKKNN